MLLLYSNSPLPPSLLLLLLLPLLSLPLLLLPLLFTSTFTLTPLPTSTSTPSYSYSTPTPPYFHPYFHSYLYIHLHFYFYSYLCSTSTPTLTSYVFYFYSLSPTSTQRLNVPCLTYSFLVSCLLITTACASSPLVLPGINYRARGKAKESRNKKRLGRYELFCTADTNHLAVSHPAPTTQAPYVEKWLLALVML